MLVSGSGEGGKGLDDCVDAIIDMRGRPSESVRCSSRGSESIS